MLKLTLAFLLLVSLAVNVYSYGQGYMDGLQDARMGFAKTMNTGHWKWTDKHTKVQR